MNSTNSHDGRLFVRDGALKEYEARIQEIRATDASILQFIGIMFTATAGITAAGLAVKDPNVFVLALLLLIVGNLYVAEKRWVIWLNGTYIKTYLEGEETGIWWEHRLDELKSRVGSPVGGIKRVELLIFVTAGLIQVLFFALADVSGLIEGLRVRSIDDLPDFVRVLSPFLLFTFLVLLASKNYRALKRGKADAVLLSEFRRASQVGDGQSPAKERDR